MTTEQRLREEFLKSPLFISDAGGTPREKTCKCQECDTNRHSVADWWLSKRREELEGLLKQIDGMKVAGHAVEDIKKGHYGFVNTNLEVHEVVRNMALSEVSSFITHLLEQK